jgi:hypothetical protein
VPREELQSLVGKSHGKRQLGDPEIVRIILRRILGCVLRGCGLYSSGLVAAENLRAS